jgi:hypothetical protein
MGIFYMDVSANCQSKTGITLCPKKSELGRQIRNQEEE